MGRGDQGARRRVLRRLREARPDVPLPHLAGRELRHQQLHPARRGATASAARSTSCTSAAACRGHIKLVPKFLQWVQDGYKVYTDTSWAIGFGARWLLTEIEKHRRRRRPGVLRLRRAVVGLRQRVLEAQRRSATSRRSSRTACSGRTTRRPSGRMADARLDLDDRTLLVELQSLGVRVVDESPDAAPRAAAAARGRRTRCSCGCAGCR